MGVRNVTKNNYDTTEVQKARIEVHHVAKNIGINFAL